MKEAKKYLALTLAIMLFIQVSYSSMVFAGPYYTDLKVMNAYMGNTVYPMQVINDFNTPEQVAMWQKGSNTSSVTFVTSLLNGPGQPFEGDGCLEQQPEKVKAYEWRSIYRDFDTPLDLSGANFITLAADCWGWMGDGFYLKLTLYSGTDSYEAIGRILENKWNVVYYDIAKWDKRNEITKMEISFVNNFDLENVVEGQPGYAYWDGRFQIDYICATQAAGMSFDIDGNTEGFVASNGTATALNGILKYGISTENSYLESGVLKIDAEKRNILQISMRNASEAAQIKVNWITEQDQEWSDDKSKSFNIRNSDIMSEYNFELGDKESWIGTIRQIRITPQSADVGSFMDIDSIRFGYKKIELNTYKGRVDICIINEDKSSIRIEGKVHDEYLLQNPNANIQLFELAPYEEENTFKYSDEIALDSKVISADFSFTVPLMRDMDHSRIYSKFVAAARQQDGQYILLDCGKYITNVEVLALNTEPFPRTQNIKGLQVQMISDAEELGVQHAGINISYNSMLYRNYNHPQNTILYHFEGEDFYFKKSTIDYLDNQIKSLTDNDMVVSAILIMYKTEMNQDTPNEFIVHPDSDNQGTVYAVNTTNEIGVKYYKAITNFIAERYSRVDKKYGQIMNYIVGNEVGQNKIWNNMGPKLLPDYVKEYERTLRLTNTIVKSNCKEARTYISLDHFWNAENSPDALWNYDNKLLVDVLNDYVQAGGNFGWHMAFHPYPEDLFDPEFWKDTSATDSFNTYRITFKNLDVLVKYLQQQHLLYNGEQRRIILSEQGFHSNNTPEHQVISAAAYAYAYYKVKFLPGIDSFILHRHVDHALEGGLNLGLWTNEPGEVCSPYEPKKMYEVFKYIDTEHSLQVTEFAKAVIGIDSWESVIPGFSEELLERRPVATVGIAGKVVPSAITGEVNLSDFEKESGTDGWEPAENMQSLAVTSDERLNGEKSLKGTIMTGYKKDYKGIVKSFDIPLDLSQNSYLYTGVKLTGMGPQINDGFVMLRAYSGTQVCEGIARVVPGEWNRVALDLSGWNGRSSVNKIKIWALPAGYTQWGNGAMYIDDVGAAEYAILRNTEVTLMKNSKVVVGDTLTLNIRNHGNTAINGLVSLEGLNGVGIDKTQEMLDLGSGEEANIAFKINALDIVPMTRGQLRVTLDEQVYLYNLTEVFVPEVIYRDDMAIFGDFEDSSLDMWVKGQNTASIGSVQRDTKSGTGQHPSKANNGSYMIEAVKGAVVATTPSSVVKELSQPIDLSDYVSLKFSFFGWGGTSSKYIVGLNLTSESGEKYTYEQDYSGNGWITVNADISSWIARDQLKKVEISYRGADTAYYGGAWGGCFYIDYVRAMKPATLTKIQPVKGSETISLHRGITQIQVKGTLSDGMLVDLTPASSGTTYISSNPSVISVSADGLVRAIGAGKANVSIKNSGKTAVATITVDKRMPVVLTDFETGSEGWSVGQNTAGAVSIWSTGGLQPSAGIPSARVGGKMLQVDMSPVAPDALKTAAKTFETPLDLSESTEVKFWVYGWGGVPGASGYKVICKLTSQNGEEFVQEFSCASDRWIEFTADISEYRFRNAITKMEIGYKSVGGDIPAWGGRFFIDSIAAKDTAAPAYTLEANNVTLSEGASFDDCYPVIFRVTDSLSGAAFANITIDDITYALDPQTQSCVEINLAGKTGSYTAVIVTEDIAGNRREESFSFVITTSINSISRLIDDYVQSGDLGAPLAVQLRNNLKQAQHQLEKDRPDAAAKHLEDLIKHLNNKALAEHVNDDVKIVLNSDAQAVINMLKSQ